MILAVSSSKSSSAIRSKEGDIAIEANNLDYDVTVKVAQFRGLIALEIRMERMFIRSFVEIVAPCGLLVIVSWVREAQLNDARWNSTFLFLPDQLSSSARSNPGKDWDTFDSVSLHSQHLELSLERLPKIWWEHDGTSQMDHHLLDFHLAGHF